VSRQRPTIRDVAQAAGVSVAVVSYAFNRPDRVASATRERVLATAAALGYTGPDPVARALRLGRQGAVALVGGAGAEGLMADAAAVQLTRGLAHTCDRAGLSLMLTGRPSSPVDGIVAFRTLEVTPGGGPVVVVDPPGPTDLPRVSALLEQGAAAAAAHLARLGHRRLAVLAWPGCGDRLAGARRGWGDAGPLHVIMAPGPERLDGEPTGRAALGLDPAPTAVLALSDPLAGEALDAAANQGLTVPHDLSVVGMDDLPGSAAVGLSTVFVPYRPMGELAGGLLLALLSAAEPPAAPPLPTELILRRTAARPAVPRTQRRASTSP